MMFLCGRARHSKPSQRDGLECLAAIQKLFGSFKGDAFDKRVLPFFHACNDCQAGQVPFRRWADRDQEYQSPLMADLRFTKESNTEHNSCLRRISDDFRMLSQ